ncbi:MAG: hypothetical protein NC095_00590 [Muribaculum sp.]|nr:hypothetical protein [Muribaculum sp.]
MKKDEFKSMTKSDEQLFAAQISGVLLKDWEKGKKFLATSDRTIYLFEPSSSSDITANSLKNKTLSFEFVESSVNPDLKEECIIVFSDGGVPLRYNTGKSPDDALQQIDSSKIPLLSDLDLIAQWRNKLVGKTLWTRNNLWYDENGQRVPGLKFSKVEVLDVMPAAADFPMLVKMNHDGNIAYVFMNYTSDASDSRNFSSLFYLSDPKAKYPDISDENWSLIQSGRVGLGMTKEECRLAIGYPDELRSGHDSSQTLDIWQYSDGTYLFFSDGLLTNFRQ